MSTSLWTMPVAELLARTASSDPTPGGGSVAAVAGALGVGLLRMAVAVTADGELGARDVELVGLSDQVEAAADGDVADFEDLMAAFALPRDDEHARSLRDRRVEEAAVAATQRPLDLGGALLRCLALGRELEALVKPAVVSDVRAGCDLVRGAALAAVRTADVNLALLHRRGSTSTELLQARRDEVVAELGGAA